MVSETIAKLLWALRQQRSLETSPLASPLWVPAFAGMTWKFPNDAEVPE